MVWTERELRLLAHKIDEEFKQQIGALIMSPGTPGPHFIPKMKFKYAEKLDKYLKNVIFKTAVCPTQKEREQADHYIDILIFANEADSAWNLVQKWSYAQNNPANDEAMSYIRMAAKQAIESHFNVKLTTTQVH